MHPIRSFLTPPAIADENVACPAIGKEQEAEGHKRTLTPLFWTSGHCALLLKILGQFTGRRKKYEKLSTMYKILTQTFLQVYANYFVFYSMADQLHRLLENAFTKYVLCKNFVRVTLLYHGQNWTMVTKGLFIWKTGWPA